MMRTEVITSITALLRRQSAAHGDKIAYEDAKGGVSYRQLDQRTANMASQLADLGIAAGDTVAMLLPNSVAWVEASFGITRAGAVSVPIAYDASEPEIAYRLIDAKCRLVVTTDEKAGTIGRLRAQCPDLKFVVLMQRGVIVPGFLRLNDILSKPGRAAPRDPDTIDSPAYIVYTSGTTGQAKGVLLTVRGMLWVTAACWMPVCGLSEHDTVLSPLPLFHSYALNLSVISTLAAGATTHIMERWSTPDALALLRTGRFSFMPGVPTMFHYLLQGAADEAKAAGGAGKPVHFPGLRLCVSAGAILPATLNSAFETQFGVQLLDGYGITETSTMVTMNSRWGTRVMGSCGLPLPGLAVRIVDPATWRDVDLGQEGELIVRGPNVMPGYHNKPDETAAALKEGWYRTGDRARSDANGYLTITGRFKELIIRGGQNIAPAEIEEAVNKFPAVLDSAVVGVPHATLGEVAVLCVVPRPGEKIVPEVILSHCRQHLSAYKVPESVHLVDEIPRTGSGKIIRFKLKEQLGSVAAG